MFCLDAIQYHDIWTFQLKIYFSLQQVNLFTHIKLESSFPAIPYVIKYVSHTACNLIIFHSDHVTALHIIECECF